MENQSNLENKAANLREYITAQQAPKKALHVDGVTWLPCGKLDVQVIIWNDNKLQIKLHNYWGLHAWPPSITVDDNTTPEEAYFELINHLLNEKLMPEVHFDLKFNPNTLRLA